MCIPHFFQLKDKLIFLGREGRFSLSFFGTIFLFAHYLPFPTMKVPLVDPMEREERAVVGCSGAAACTAALIGARAGTETETETGMGEGWEGWKGCACELSLTETQKHARVCLVTTRGCYNPCMFLCLSETHFDCLCLCPSYLLRVRRAVISCVGRACLV
jgi:hypothetical protein